MTVSIEALALDFCPSTHVASAYGFEIHEVDNSIIKGAGL